MPRCEFCALEVSDRGVHVNGSLTGIPQCEALKTILPPADPYDVWSAKCVRCGFVIRSHGMCNDLLARLESHVQAHVTRQDQYVDPVVRKEEKPRPPVRKGRWETSS